ncbi:diacylglycerol/polyprenol kinase family protein [Nanoarchaeota archaeon]
MNKLEIKRQLWHLLGGLGLVALIYFDLVNFWYLLIGFFGVAVLFIVYQKFWKIPVLRFFIENLERKNNLEKYPGMGSLLFLLSAVIVVGLFPKEIAMAGLVILAFGDSIPVLFGGYGRIQYFHNKKKTWEGILMGIVLSALAARLFVAWYEAWIAAAVVMLIEGFDLKIFGWKLDDNLMIPILAGLIIYLLRIII